jgi:hypothetical protein
MLHVKKCLVSAAGPNMAPILDSYSLPTFNQYASKNNYSVYIERLETDSLARKDEHAKRARWKKISIMREALMQNDIVVWFDADILIRRFDEDLALYLRPNDYQGLVLHSVPAENRINPNTGVWIMRKSSKAFAFLDAIEAIGMPPGRWSDQGAVMQALGWITGDAQYYGAHQPDVATEFITGTAWLPTGWNQPYCENRPNPQAYVGRPIVESPHALHFMAMTNEERQLAMGAIVARNHIQLTTKG